MSSFILSPVSNQVTIGCSPGFEDLEEIVHLILKKAETLDFSANFLSKFSLHQISQFKLDAVGEHSNQIVTVVINSPF